MARRKWVKSPIFSTFSARANPKTHCQTHKQTTLAKTNVLNSLTPIAQSHTRIRDPTQTQNQKAKISRESKFKGQQARILSEVILIRIFSSLDRVLIASKENHFQQTQTCVNFKIEFQNIQTIEQSLRLACFFFECRFISLRTIVVFKIPCKW